MRTTEKTPWHALVFTRACLHGHDAHAELGASYLALGYADCLQMARSLQGRARRLVIRADREQARALQAAHEGDR